jgi:nitroreductase
MVANMFSSSCNPTITIFLTGCNYTLSALHRAGGRRFHFVHIQADISALSVRTWACVSATFSPTPGIQFQPDLIQRTGVPSFILEPKRMTASASEVHHLKKAPDVEGVLPVILHRWSPRAFSDKDVSSKDLKTVFEAVRWAASSSNEQPWRFLVGRRNSETYKKIHDTLVPFNQMWAGRAPVLILGVAKTKFSHNGEPNRVALFDLGAASSYLTLQASALGLATHQMAGFDPEAARKAFQVPEEYVFGSVIAVGYQGDPATLPHEKMLTQEIAPRTRKELSEFVFEGWERAAELG